jgi:1-acyl-sn-glycerol-3-phosphate acyltransferase
MHDGKRYMKYFSGFFAALFDFLITMLLWLYFTLGYIFCFLPLYPFVFIFSRDRELTFQALNHYFLRGFFFLFRNIIPGLEIVVSEEVRSLSSSVIVSNHISYLDPILLVSLVKKHKTIVKGILFKVPVFGQALKLSGHFPFSGDNSFDSPLIDKIDGLKGYFNKGGNLFIFPEGTRRKDGSSSPFRKGAFYIAKKCDVPIQLLIIQNTNVLLKPGRFFLNTRVKTRITVDLIQTISPESPELEGSTIKLVHQIEALYAGYMGTGETQASASCLQKS